MAYKNPSDRYVRAWQSCIYRHIRETNRLHFNLNDTDFDRHYITELYNNQNAKCYWFGIDLIPSRTPRHPYQPSIDRLDNDKGYTKSNIVLCSLMANMARNSLQEHEWKDIIKDFKHQIIYNHKLLVNKFDGDQMLLLL